jgi:hypothetical protein
MLRAYALQYGRSWDKGLPYAEFSYNNSYQESLKMAPFEMLYGRRCQTPLFWSGTRERKVFGPNILQEAEKQVRMVRENMWIAQSRQKSYAYERFVPFQDTRQAHAKVYWSVQDYREER